MIRNAIVTGGAKGIGAAVARHLASEQWKVTILDTAVKEGKVATDTFPCDFLEVDVANAAAVEDALKAVVKKHGSIDGVVASAGTVGPQVPLHELRLEDWHRVSDVNLNGTFYTLKYALRQMVKQVGGGSVVLMSSIGGFRGFPNLGSYPSGKWAIRGLAQQAAVEYCKKNIRVNAIAPTACETELLKGFIESSSNPDSKRAELASINALPGIVQPSDVAEAAAFLLSSKARYITGHTLPVDAGFLSRPPNAAVTNVVEDV